MQANSTEWFPNGMNITYPICFGKWPILNGIQKIECEHTYSFRLWRFMQMTVETNKNKGSQFKNDDTLNIRYLKAQ